MPSRSRGNSSVPRTSITERRPLCPPWLPRSRTRIRPRSRATSSRTTTRSCGPLPFRPRRRSTETPLRFMKVTGLTRRASAPPISAQATHASATSLPFRTPARAASASTTMYPTLWRVRRYRSPGLPRPTTKRMRAPPPPGLLLLLLLALLRFLGLLFLGLPLGGLALLDDLGLGSSRLL